MPPSLISTGREPTRIRGGRNNRVNRDLPSMLYTIVLSKDRACNFKNNKWFKEPCPPEYREIGRDASMRNREGQWRKL
jgi:hypothetical protein